MQFNPEVHKIAPISWQSSYGVPNLKKAEKDQMRIDHPGKSATWYQNEGRRIRKQRILNKSKTYFDISDNSDNVGDAVGIARYVVETLTRP